MLSRNGKDSFVLLLSKIFPRRISLFPGVVVWVQVAFPCLSVSRFSIHFNFMLLETNDGIFLKERASDTLGIVSIENLGVQNKYTIRFFHKPQSEHASCEMIRKKVSLCMDHSLL